MLALAGAALTATGVIAYGILIAPLPYEKPGELVFLQRQSIRTGGNLNFTPADYLDVARQARTLEPVAAAGVWSPVITGMDAAERLRGLHVSGELFRVLGRSATLGRVLEPSDDSPQAAPAAVISTRLYQRMFGGDPETIGREVRLDGEMFTIVGVMPAGFEFPTFWATGVDIWAPMRWTAEEAGSRNAAWLRAFGRLAPGANLEQAQAEVSTISESLRAQFPDSHADRGVRLVGLQDQTVREVRPALTALAAGAALLWLLAIVNLTALAVVRATRPLDRDRRAAGAGRIAGARFRTGRSRKRPAGIDRRRARSVFGVRRHPHARGDRARGRGFPRRSLARDSLGCMDAGFDACPRSRCDGRFGRRRRDGFRRRAAGRTTQGPR